ncbi:MAG: oxidoreductase [Paracoccaceae bacterium]|nr:MAG: oxidoreductase [Paracoccaceae bacterium]
MSLIDALAAALGPDAVTGPEAIPARNMADTTGLPPTRPRALIRPRDVAGVSAALRLCHAAGQPVCVQGGMTGLAAGGHPGPEEIALSLERLVGIEEVDPDSATLTALAGTPLHSVQEAARAAGFVCGIDLGARGSCTIGGNVATNAGGNQVLRYGMARANVLGLEAVLADGTVVTRLNKMLKNNTGFDWTQLMIGSEGCLGVITRVVLALHPDPGPVETALLAVPDTAALLAALRRLQAAFPAGLMVFEAMWREFMALAEERLGLTPAFAPRPEICVLVEIAAPRARVEAALEELIATGLAGDAVLAGSGRDRARLWAFRETPYEYHRLFPRFAGFDISFPRQAIARAVAAIRAEAAAHWPDRPMALFGHVADSNLHVIVGLPEGAPDGAAIEARIYALTGRLGGSVSAEHGIGRAKRRWLGLSRSPEEIALMRALKRALDPRGILNPGRVLPDPG